MMSQRTGLWASALVLGTTLALSGCDKPASKPSGNTETSAQGSSSESNVPTAKRVLKGEVIYREREALREGSELRVQLNDVSRADAPSRLISEQVISTRGQVPIAFELHYDEADLTRGFTYSVGASIRDPEGDLRWISMDHNDPKLEVGKDPAAMEIMLGKVTDPDERILPDEAVWSEPWDKARERGVTFRAVGNEPGWYLEVSGKKHLKLVMDYGEKVAETDSFQLRPVENGDEYRAELAGNPIRVVALRKGCEDDMSGEAFSYTVEVELDGQNYKGCGRTL